MLFNILYALARDYKYVEDGGSLSWFSILVICIIFFAALWHDDKTNKP